MFTPSPVIHVLDKLAPSCLRLRPRILGLTTNNLSYARLCHLMGWYDIYPLPLKTPEPYNDSEKFGRIAAWGYAEIVESTVPEISSGQTVYGFLPISSGLEDIRIEFAEHAGQKIKDQIIVLNEHRQHLSKVYNRYRVCAPLAELEKAKTLDSLGWDSLMQSLFETSYNLSTYGFAWNEENRIHPASEGEWSTADADLHDATIVILNASGKTAMSFAYALRRHRPAEHQPKTIIGVASPASLSVVSQSGLYDKVALNSEFQTTTAEIEKSAARRVVFLDFGARQGANATWKSALSSSSVPFTLITVGGEVSALHPDEAIKGFADSALMNIVNASLLREKGIEVGGPKYFEESNGAFDEFKKRVCGLKLLWGEGLEGWERGWEALCRDEVRANTGLVYRV